ncbi:MAG: hypothetical protein K6B74_10490 [Ruminococcus sp.]|nr:hypothetical protein [Ruminococcus sp.]
MNNKFKPGSFLGKRAEIMDTSRFEKFVDTPYPDPDRQSLTMWSYDDIKMLVDEIMEAMRDMAFTYRESAEFVYQTLQLSIWNDKRGAQFTENLLIYTAIMCFLIKEKCHIDGVLRDKYKAMLDEWSLDHYRGYRLTVEEEEALEKDIRFVLTKLERVGETIIPDNLMVIHDFLTDASPTSWCRSLGHTNLYRDTTPPGYVEKMQGVLSDDAFLLITRFERDYYNPYRYRFFLEANGMRLTPEVQRYFDLYDGRAFIYRDASFYINHHCGLNRIKGYNTSNDVGAIVMNNYYLLILSKLTTPGEGLFIDMYGRIHEYANGFLRYAANNFEDYVELYARKQRRSWYIINKRKEIEDNYFVPEIRLLGMKKLRRGVYV